MIENGEMAPPAPSDRMVFILKEKVFDMVKYGKKLAERFPPRDRKIANELKSTMIDMFELVIIIEKKYYKKTTLQELDVKLEVLKNLVILASDKDYYNEETKKRDKQGNLMYGRDGKPIMSVIPPPLSMHSRFVWNSMNAEIGRMIGGYLKTAK